MEGGKKKTNELRQLKIMALLMLHCMYMHTGHTKHYPFDSKLNVRCKCDILNISLIYARVNERELSVSAELLLHTVVMCMCACICDIIYQTDDHVYTYVKNFR